jgi:hypothetical protein
MTKFLDLIMLESGPPVFSPDSKQILYAAKIGNKWYIVIDGKEEGQYDDVSRPYFTGTKSGT